MEKIQKKRKNILAARRLKITVINQYIKTINILMIMWQLISQTISRWFNYTFSTIMEISEIYI